MELLTVPEAARLLKLSRSQLYALCQRQVIPTVRIGRSVRIPRDELEAWVRRQVAGGEEVLDRVTYRAFDRG